jgi:rsbT antagonist protein RsbS
VNGVIPILRMGDVLVTTVHVELRDATAEAFQTDVLSAIEKSRAKGLIIDISGLDMVDSYVARILAETGRMARLMGTTAVLCGMRPEVSATLVRMGFPMGRVQTALDLEEGLELLRGQNGGAERE